MAPRKLLKSCLQNILLVALSLSIGLLGAEFAVRLLFPHYDLSGQVKFAELSDGTTMGEPGKVARQFKNTGDYDVTIRFNEIGFRDTKNVKDSKQDSIFAVGASDVFGWGVQEEERFSNLLEKTLGQPVFNISMPGDNFEGYAKHIQIAERYGATVKRMIVTVSMETDIRIYPEKQMTPLPADLTVMSTSGIEIRDFHSLKRWLQENSSAYFLLTTIVHQSPRLESFAAKLGLVMPEIDALIARGVPTDRAVESAANRLIKLASGRDVVVLIVPSRQLWVGDSDDRTKYSTVHYRFTEILRQAGLKVVDLRQPLEKSGKPLEYHFKNDGHWNAKGHRVAADELLVELGREANATVSISK